MAVVWSAATPLAMTVEMSLQEASEARKARLLAFRTRKEQGGAGING